MTQEQEKIFKKELWRWHIDETSSNSEYDIAEHFFNLGLNSKDNEKE